MLKEKCVYCLKEFPLQSLRAHVLTCLSSSYLSDDDTGDVREEDSAPSDVESNNDNISESNRSLEVSNNISDSEVIDITDTLETNISTDTIEDIIIDKEIVDITEHCKTKDLNNPVEILKYMQTRLVQERPLEIEDVTQCISGATNFIMVDWSDLINTGLEEIQHIFNKFVTLEVQF